MTPHAANAPAPGPTPRWRLRLLGALDLHDAQGEVQRWPSRTAARLLARLALAPQRVHPREELVELLWPGVAVEVGRNRLRQTLSTLKSLLERDDDVVVEADRHGLRLRAGRLWCDATAFERHVREGRTEQALALYAGELMPGVFDEWVLEMRAPLAAQAERLLAAPVSAVRAPDPLPASWTRVFGLEPVQQQLLALLQAERLVTVVGPGGCGKTRLALETARRAQQLAGLTGFERVIFVPLVDCRTEAHALASLAGTLQLGSGDTLRQAADRLAGQRVLLVLDNFEQLAASAAALPMALLEALPGLHLLLTSRLRVGWPGEQVFPLAGLPLPAAHADAAELATNPAVALYLDRARAVSAAFAVEACDLPAVAELVRRLDGMPLALELAASRAQAFPPPRLLQLLEAGHPDGMHLELLTCSVPRAGHDARHTSIATVIDWSWRLLDPLQQSVMRALAAGAGDMGTPALAAMLAQSAATVALRLDELAAHSMLRLLPGPQGPRVAVLEPVREFVRTRCSADRLRGMRQALQDWLLQWAQGLSRAAATSLVEPELPLVHAVLADPGDDPRPALQLALALRAHWECSGMPLALQQPLEGMLARHDQELGARGVDGLSAELHELLAYLRFEAGFTPQALAHAEAALVRAGTDPSRRARALARRAWIDVATGPAPDLMRSRAAQLQSWLDEALALARSAADHDAEARALHASAVLVSKLQDDWAGAERLFERSQQLWLGLGDRRKAFARLRNRAQCWLRLGRPDEARSCFETCVRVAREDGNVVEHIDSLVSLSSLLGGQRRWREALAADRECVQLCWRHWHRHGLAYALWNPPLALAHLRRPHQALRLMAFAAGFWTSIAGALSAEDGRTVRRVRRLCRAQLGAAAEAALWTDGATMTVAQAVELALQDECPRESGAAAVGRTGRR